MAALLALPSFADNYILHVMARLFVYVLVALGLNLLVGYAGQVSLGHAAFFAIGAYTAAVLAESWRWSFVPCVLAAAGVTAVVGYLLGLPCLRLSGLYLAMATLGFTLIVQEMLLQLAVITHGSEGMSVKPATILGLKFDSDYRKYYLLLVITIGMLLFARNLVRGRTGRAFLAIRENERAAEAMGVNLAQYKTIAFAISALYTGLAGALSAYLVGFLDPQEFSFFLSIQFITIIILGGLASLLGSVLGAGFLIILPELLGRARRLAGARLRGDHGPHHHLHAVRAQWRDSSLWLSLVRDRRRAHHPAPLGALTRSAARHAPPPGSIPVLTSSSQAPLGAL